MDPGRRVPESGGDVSKGTAATLMTLFYTGMVVSRVALIRAVRKIDISHLLLASFVIALAGFLLLAGGPKTELKALGLLYPESVSR